MRAKEWWDAKEVDQLVVAQMVDHFPSLVLKGSKLYALGRNSRLRTIPRSRTLT